MPEPLTAEKLRDECVEVLEAAMDRDRILDADTRRMMKLSPDDGLVIELVMAAYLAGWVRAGGPIDPEITP